MSEADSASEWISVRAACAILRCGEETVRKLCRRRQITHRQHGYGTVPRYELLRRDVLALREAQIVPCDTSPTIATITTDT